MISKSAGGTNLASITLSATSVLAFSGSAMAAAIGVDWTTATRGNLNGTTVILSNIVSPSLSVGNLSVHPFSSGSSSRFSLSSNQEIIAYSVRSNWTATFSNPVSNLLLYIVDWRGVGGGVDPVSYTFTQFASRFAFSASANITPINNTPVTAPSDFNILILPANNSDGGFVDAIIQFTGPVSTLSVDTNSTSNSFQALTFGIENNSPAATPENSPAATPEPGSVLALLGLGLGVLVSQGKKQG